MTKQMTEQQLAEPAVKPEASIPEPAEPAVQSQPPQAVPAVSTPAGPLDVTLAWLRANQDDWNATGLMPKPIGGRLPRV